MDLSDARRSSKMCAGPSIASRKTQSEKNKRTRKVRGNKAAETEEGRSSTFPQWTFKKLENAVVMVTQQIRQQSTHRGAIGKRERKK